MKIKTTKIIEFKTKDHLLLPGLIFEPEEKTEKVAIYLHGNGSSSIFYQFDRISSIAEKLNEIGVSFMPFNNRGAHYIKKIDKLENGKLSDLVIGAAYEKIKDSIVDIDSAIKFLTNLGYEQFYLIGHSTGANKICVYNYYKQDNKVSKYILLAGGDDVGILHNWMGGTKKFKEYIQKAKEKIKQGKGNKFIPKYMLDYIISYQSFYDICNPDGDYNIFPFNEYMNELNLSNKQLFREYKSIDKPTLVVYGENDEYCYGDTQKILNILKKEAPDNNLFDFKIVPKANHGFDGYEKELAKFVAKWLKK